MFDVAPTELLLVAVIALLVIGPKELPRLMRSVGQWVGRARGVARHFKTGLDAMVREAELEEMEQKWKAENERIMRDYPASPAPEPVIADQPLIQTAPDIAPELPFDPPVTEPKPHPDLP